MLGSGSSEPFYCGLHAGAGGPDVVKEDVGGVGVDVGVWSQGVGHRGLVDASGVVGADLDGTIGASKEFLN